MIKYFTSCSARKMLVTTLGVVLTLSVMWICRPSAHPLPSSRILRTPKESRFQTTSGSTSVELQSTLTSRKLKTRKLNINKRLLQNNYHSQMNITYNRVVPTELNSSDVYVSVRTTPLFHKSRLLLLLHTWLQTIDPKQVYSRPRPAWWLILNGGYYRSMLGYSAQYVVITYASSNLYLY